MRHLRRNLNPDAAPTERKSLKNIFGYKDWAPREPETFDRYNVSWLLIKSNCLSLTKTVAKQQLKTYHVIDDTFIRHKQSTHTT